MFKKVGEAQGDLHVGVHTLALNICCRSVHLHTNNTYLVPGRRSRLQKLPVFSLIDGRMDKAQKRCCGLWTSTAVRKASTYSSTIITFRLISSTKNLPHIRVQPS